MTFKELNSLFEHPEQVGRGQFSDLRELLSAYPFVSSFHLLYQKGLSNESDVICDAELQRTVMFAPDRNQLMLLLMPKPSNVSPSKESVTQVSSSQEPVKVSLKDLAPANSPVVLEPNPEVLETSETSAPDAAPMMFADEVNAFLSHFEESQASKQAAAAGDEEQPLRVSSFKPQFKGKADVDSSSDNRSDEKPKTEFFTETLAKIYIKQEKFDKAIGIYEKLAVKNPDKAEYYNEQVRFLNKLIKYM